MNLAPKKRPSLEEMPEVIAKRNVSIKTVRANGERSAAADQPAGS
jgi:hypothetical protein